MTMKCVCRLQEKTRVPGTDCTEIAEEANAAHKRVAEILTVVQVAARF